MLLTQAACWHGRPDTKNVPITLSVTGHCPHLPPGTSHWYSIVPQRLPGKVLNNPAPVSTQSSTFWTLTCSCVAPRMLHRSPTKGRCSKWFGHSPEQPYAHKHLLFWWERESVTWLSWASAPRRGSKTFTLVLMSRFQIKWDHPIFLSLHLLNVSEQYPYKLLMLQRLSSKST